MVKNSLTTKQLMDSLVCFNLQLSVVLKQSGHFIYVLHDIRAVHWQKFHHWLIGNK